MNFKELKESAAWAQLATEERRFLKEHLNNPRKATKVRIILERAEIKAHAQSRIKLPPPQLDITLPSGIWRATFLTPEEVELKGEIVLEGRVMPVSVVFCRAPSQNWVVRQDFAQGPLQGWLALEFEDWVKTHPNFVQFTRGVLP